MYSIYTLSDPRDNSIRYVGMSKNPQKRYAMHLLYPSKNPTEKDAWIKELLGVDMAPILSIVESNITRIEAEQREGYWIGHYSSLYPNLTNRGKMPPKPYTPASHGAMEMKEIEQIITAQGWTVGLQTRRNKGKLYLYAVRKIKGTRKNESRYICAQSKIGELTEQEVLAKLR